MLESSLGIQTVSYPEAVASLELLMDLGEPAVLHGPPGIGKTTLIEELGARHKRHVETFMLSQTDPTALYGLRFPDVERGVTVQMRPDLLPSPTDTRDWIIFFDELGNVAAPSVRMAAMQLLDKRQIGSVKLDKRKHWIAAAMNLGAEDGVTNIPLDAMAADRLVHLRIELSLDDWVTGFAVKQNMTPHIVGFLRAHPNEFNPFGEASAKTVRPTPRSWAKIDRLIKQMRKDNEGGIEFMSSGSVQACISGIVGEAAGMLFTKYCENSDSFAMIDELWAAKNMTELRKLMPKKAQGLYTLAAGLHQQLRQLKDDGEQWDALKRAVDICLLLSKSRVTGFKGADSATWAANLCLDAVVDNKEVLGPRILEQIYFDKSTRMEKFRNLAQMGKASDSEFMNEEAAA